jgi:beta propeller repeat protein
MTQQPGDSLVSKIVFIGALLILLLIMGACVFVIYGYVSPHGPVLPSSTPLPSPVATYTPMPTERPIWTPTPNATITPTPDTGYYQEDTKVTTGEFDFYYPGVWDHYIVYDMFDGMKNYSMLYDTYTRDTSQIADGTVFSYGTMSNGKVLLYYPKGSKIYLYDIKDKRPDLTCTNDDNARGSFTMFDTKLAYYQDVGHFNTDGEWVPVYSIRVFNAVDGYAASVIDNSPLPLDIKIYGDRLVYTVVSGQGSDVYLLDLATLKPAPQKISAGPGANNYGRIYGNVVVFISDTSGKNRAYIYDINTGKTTNPTAEGEQRHIAIYGNTIVYDDNREGNWNIYAYDLNTHVERRVTNEPHDQMDPVINGNRIAYMDNRNGYWAIYTMTI